MWPSSGTSLERCPPSEMRRSPRKTMKLPLTGQRMASHSPQLAGSHIGQELAETMARPNQPGHPLGLMVQPEESAHVSKANICSGLGLTVMVCLRGVSAVAFEGSGSSAKGLGWNGNIFFLSMLRASDATRVLSSNG